MMSMDRFISKFRLTMTSHVAIERRPDRLEDAGGKHWRLRLTAMRDGTRTAIEHVFFTCAPDRSTPPNLNEVLQSLRRDCLMVRDIKNFKQFCDEFELDKDSRAANKLFVSCRRNARRLKTELLSSIAYETFLDEVEG